MQSSYTITRFNDNLKSVYANNFSVGAGYPDQLLFQLGIRQWERLSDIYGYTAGGVGGVQCVVMAGV